MSYSSVFRKQLSPMDKLDDKLKSLSDSINYIRLHARIQSKFYDDSMRKELKQNLEELVIGFGGIGGVIATADKLHKDYAERLKLPANNKKRISIVAVNSSLKSSMYKIGKLQEELEELSVVIKNIEDNKKHQSDLKRFFEGTKKVRSWLRNIHREHPGENIFYSSQFELKTLADRMNICLQKVDSLAIETEVKEVYNPLLGIETEHKAERDEAAYKKWVSSFTRDSKI